MLDNISAFFNKYIPLKIEITDIIEIIILAVVFYEIMLWIRKTKAWILFKGIAIILAFTLLASILHLNTILWLAEKTLSVGIIAIVIIFQPELRKALEQIGQKNIISRIFNLDNKRVSERFSDKTI
ncbi:MAG: TIGR00159 family protein, partial [Lachnospiraceae bacterium]|nr:TIGR00159 family protein [Lachnospiraceae bacterium]